MLSCLVQHMFEHIGVCDGGLFSLGAYMEWGNCVHLHGKRSSPKDRRVKGVHTKKK